MNESESSETLKETLTAQIAALHARLDKSDAAGAKRTAERNSNEALTRRIAELEGRPVSRSVNEGERGDSVLCGFVRAMAATASSTRRRRTRDYTSERICTWLLPRRCTWHWWAG